MNEELIVLRLGHIVAGTFWVGAAVYLAMVLEPKLRVLGDDIEGRVTSEISKLNSIWITASAVITITFGFALVERTPGRGFDQLGDSGWGTAMLIGIVASGAAFLFSGMNGATVAKHRRLLEGVRGREADAGENALLDGYRARIRLWSRVNALLVVVAVGAMASARFA